MKKITLTLLVLVVVTVTTAFIGQSNAAVKKNVTDYAYFQYLGGEPDGENDAQNWLKVSNPQNLCEVGNRVLCTIMAPIANSADDHPDFTGITDVRGSTVITQKVYKP